MYQNEAEHATLAERDDGPMGLCSIQDSEDETVVTGYLDECRDWFNDNADPDESYHLYDENGRAWEIGRSFGLYEAD